MLAQLIGYIRRIRAGLSPRKRGGLRALAFAPVAIFAIALAVLAAVAALSPSDASAHANYLESEPPANSTLETAPDSVVIRFTEPIERSLSSMRVLDPGGRPR